MSERLEQDHCSVYLRAVAEPGRLRIVRLLRAGPKTVGEIVAELDAPIANVSHHLKMLKAAGIVAGSKRGRHVSYALDARYARQGAGRSLDVLDFGCCRIELRPR